MHVFFLTSFTVFVVMFSSMPSALVDAGLAPVKKELDHLEAVAAERAKLLAEFLRDGAPAKNDEWDSALEPEPSKAGLQHGGLQSSGLQTKGLSTKSVQPASGLHSGARGITPESEWRKMFPRKPGQK